MPAAPLPLIPEALQPAVRQAIWQGRANLLAGLLQAHQLGADSFLDTRFYSPLLLEALGAFSTTKLPAVQEVIDYLLAQGADVNRKCKAGYNCLHVAVQQEQLLPLLADLLAHGADVNEPDNRGANLVYWAVQGYRENSESAALRLVLLERILAMGGDVDQPNYHGATARGWLEHRPAALAGLVARYDELKPPYTPAPAAQPVFPTNLRHPEVARRIWKTLVPRRGPADTVQGELLRAIEKLRDEAQRNGNGNFNAMHRELAAFLGRTLGGSEVFDAPTRKRLKAASQQLGKARQPYLEDDLYDQLTDAACEFYLAHPDPIPLPAT